MKRTGNRPVGPKSWQKQKKMSGKSAVVLMLENVSTGPACCVLFVVVEVLWLFLGTFSLVFAL